MQLPTARGTYCSSNAEKYRSKKVAYSIDVVILGKLANYSTGKHSACYHSQGHNLFEPGLGGYEYQATEGATVRNVLGSLHVSYINL